jgi:hypothetical protein
MIKRPVTGLIRTTRLFDTAAFRRAGSYRRGFPSCELDRETSLEAAGRPFGIADGKSPMPNGNLRSAI